MANSCDNPCDELLEMERALESVKTSLQWMKFFIVGCLGFMTLFVSTAAYAVNKAQSAVDKGTEIEKAMIRVDEKFKYLIIKIDESSKTR